MSLAGKFILKLSYYRARARSGWYLGRLLLLEKRRHKLLEVGDRVTFNVPVRGAGLGSLIIGKGNTFGYSAAHRLGTGEILLEARDLGAEVLIGESNWFSNNISIIANQRISIGDGCQIGDMVAIYDSDFHEIDPQRRKSSQGPSSPVTIGNNV